MLSIIIINHKTPEFLRLCLQSIFNSKISLPHEVIVVDSETSRITQDVIFEEFPSVKLIPTKINTGFAKGVNEGIKNSKGEFILIINPDIIITGDSVKKLIEFLKDDPKVGLIGPKLLNFNGSLQNSCFKYYTPMTVISRRTFLGKIPPFKNINKKFLLKDKNLEITQEVDWLMGSALMTTKSIINDVGLMDERFFMYFEDVDFARRFWQKGYKVVYYPKAVFYHDHQRESKSKLGALDAIFNQKTRWHIQSSIKYFWKWK